MMRRCGAKPRLTDLEATFRNTSRLHRKFNGVDVVTPEARVSYYYAFGVLPDEQIELEALWNRTNVGRPLAGPPNIRETLSFTGHPLLLDQVNVGNRN
jgi:hypothetical protein